MLYLGFREKEDLKAEIVREIEKRKSWWSTAASHPLTLLLVGFLATGVVGSYLSSRLSQANWENQQKYLREQQLSNERLELVDEITTEVAATLAAANDVIAMVVWEWQPEGRAEEIDERLTNWRDTSSQWRTVSRVFPPKLAVYLSDSRNARRSLQTIVNKRRQIGTKIRWIIESWLKAPPETRSEMGDQAQARAKECNELINAIEDELAVLTALIAAEI